MCEILHGNSVFYDTSLKFASMNPLADTRNNQHEIPRIPPLGHGVHTPPRQTYVPGAHNYSPYPTSPPFRNLGSPPVFGASAPPTPVKGLTTQEVKSMSKIWNSPAKLIEVVSAAISAYNGMYADESQVTDILKALLAHTVTAFHGIWF